MSPVTNSPSPHPPTSTRLTFPLVLVLFGTWGFCSGLNELLVADLRGLFSLSYGSATLIQSVYFGTAFLCAYPAGRLVRSLDYHKAMIAGLSVMACGSLCFLPVTFGSVFGLLLLPIAVLSAGSALLQTAAGPYVTLLGPESGAASRFSLALAFNSLGSAVAPMAGGLLLLGRTHHSLQGLRLPYAVLASGLFLLAAGVYWVRFPEPPQRQRGLTANPAPFILRHHRRLLYGVAAMTAYVGAEVAIGSLLINFLQLPGVLAYSPVHAATLAALYGGGAMLGRFAGAFWLARTPPLRLLAVAASLAMILVTVAAKVPGTPAAIALIAVGLCNSIMVPVLFTSSLQGLGPHTDEGAGLLVAALLGGALLPLLLGSLADRVGLQDSFFLLVPCYAVVAAYSFFGTPAPGPAGRESLG